MIRLIRLGVKGMIDVTKVAESKVWFSKKTKIGPVSLGGTYPQKNIK